MSEASLQLPDPSREDATLFFDQLTVDYLNDAGWREVNTRLHGIAMAARPFFQKIYPNPADREVAFSGFTAGLLGLLRQHDIYQLNKSFTMDCPLTPEWHPHMPQLLPPSKEDA